MNQDNQRVESTSRQRSQSYKFNADEFTHFLANLPDQLKREDGSKYEKSTLQKYQRIVSFLKENQDQINLATDKNELNKILSVILKAKDDDDYKKRLATDAVGLYRFPQITSIFESNPFADGVRKYLVNFYYSLSPMIDLHYLELKDFYEENKELFDHLCNLYLLILIRIVEVDDPNAKQHRQLNQGKISFTFKRKSNLLAVENIINNNDDFASRKKEIITLARKCYNYYTTLPNDLRDPNDSVIRLARALYVMHLRKS